MSVEQPVSKIHPLQNFVNRTAPLVGFLTVALMSVISVFSIFLVINAASVIGGPVYLLTLIGGLALFGLQRYLSNFIKNNTLLVRGQKVDVLTLWITSLLICGFVQTFFWVVDSDNPIHEPRSVFILVTAGFLAFIRNQIRITQAEQAAQQLALETTPEQYVAKD